MREATVERRRELWPVVQHGPELGSWAQQVMVSPQELVFCEPWDKERLVFGDMGNT